MLPPLRMYVIKTRQLGTVRVIVHPLGIWYHLSLCLSPSRSLCLRTTVSSEGMRDGRQRLNIAHTSVHVPL